MATEILLPTSILSATGKWNGFVTNIDELIATPDGSVISTTQRNRTIRFAFSDIVTIRDIDTVTAIRVRLRTRKLNVVDGTFDVNVFINSIDQNNAGAQVNTLTTTLTNYSLTDIGWDADWSVADLNTLEVQMISTQSVSDAQEWIIDTLNVEVDYDPVVAIEKAPNEETLLLAGEQPVSDYQELFKQARPPVAPALQLSGQSGVRLDTRVAVSSRAITLLGKPSYLNPVTTTVKPNTLTPNGWSGFVTNIDEDLSAPDGSVITYTMASSDPAGNIATVGLQDVTAEILDTTDVLRVVVTVRFRGTPTGGTAPYSTWQTTLGVQLRVGGTGQGEVTATLTDSSTFSNVEFNAVAWNQDWTRAALNSMDLQVRVTDVSATDNNALPASVITDIDIISTEVQYSGQTPLGIPVPRRTLALTTGSVVSGIDYFITVAEADLLLNVKTPSAPRTLTMLSDPGALQLSGKAVAKLIRNYGKPGERSLSLTPRQSVAIVNDIVSPAAETLSLAGETPTLDWVDNHARQPGAGSLIFFLEAATADRTENRARAPAKVTRTLTGKVPTVDQSRNFWADPTARTLALSGEAPEVIAGLEPTPAVVTVTLNAQTPLRILNTIVGVPAGSLSLAGIAPVLGPYEANLVFTSYAPNLAYTTVLSPGSLAIAGAAPFSDANSLRVVFDDIDPLVLAGQIPAAKISSALATGSDSRFVSLTVKYRVEHIGQATDTSL